MGHDTERLFQHKPLMKFNGCGKGQYIELRHDTARVPNVDHNRDNLVYAVRKEPQWKPYQMTEKEKRLYPDKHWKWDVSDFYLGV